eukprot:1098624_1
MCTVSTLITYDIYNAQSDVDPSLSPSNANHRTNEGTMYDHINNTHSLSSPQAYTNDAAMCDGALPPTMRMPCVPSTDGTRMDADVSCVGLASVPQYGALPCHVPYNMPQMHPIPVFPFSTSQSGQRSFNPSLPPPNINRGTNDQYIACDTNGHAMWNEGAQALLPTMRMPCVTSTGGARMDADASCLGLTS